MINKKNFHQLPDNVVVVAAGRPWAGSFGRAVCAERLSFCCQRIVYIAAIFLSSIYPPNYCLDLLCLAGREPGTFILVSPRQKYSSKDKPIVS